MMYKAGLQDNNDLWVQLIYKTVAQETQKYASQVERERELDPSLDLILLMRYGLFVNWLVVAGK